MWAQGLTITTTGLEKYDKDAIRHDVEAGGGRYSPNLSKRTTHLVTPEVVGSVTEKLAAAAAGPGQQRFKALQVVSKCWVSASSGLRHRADEQQFAPLLPPPGASVPDDARPAAASGTRSSEQQAPPCSVHAAAAAAAGPQTPWVVHFSQLPDDSIYGAQPQPQTASPSAARQLAHQLHLQLSPISEAPSQEQATPGQHPAWSHVPNSSAQTAAHTHQGGLPQAAAVPFGSTASWQQPPGLQQVDSSTTPPMGPWQRLAASMQPAQQQEQQEQWQWQQPPQQQPLHHQQQQASLARGVGGPHTWEAAPQQQQQQQQQEAGLVSPRERFRPPALQVPAGRRSSSASSGNAGYVGQQQQGLHHQQQQHLAHAPQQPQHFPQQQQEQQQYGWTGTAQGASSVGVAAGDSSSSVGELVAALQRATCGSRRATSEPAASPAGTGQRSTPNRHSIPGFAPSAAAHPSPAHAVAGTGTVASAGAGAVLQPSHRSLDGSGSIETLLHSLRRLSDRTAAAAAATPAAEAVSHPQAGAAAAAGPGIPQQQRPSLPGQLPAQQQQPHQQQQRSNHHNGHEQEQQEPLFWGSGGGACHTPPRSTEATAGGAATPNHQRTPSPLDLSRVLGSLHIGAAGGSRRSTAEEAAASSGILPGPGADTRPTAAADVGRVSGPGDLEGLLGALRRATADSRRGTAEAAAAGINALSSSTDPVGGARGVEDKGQQWVPGGGGDSGDAGGRAGDIQELMAALQRATGDGRRGTAEAVTGAGAGAWDAAAQAGSSGSSAPVLAAGALPPGSAAGLGGGTAEGVVSGGAGSAGSIEELMGMLRRATGDSRRSTAEATATAVAPGPGGSSLGLAGSSTGHAGLMGLPDAAAAGPALSSSGSGIGELLGLLRRATGDSRRGTAEGSAVAEAAGAAAAAAAAAAGGASPGGSTGGGLALAQLLGQLRRATGDSRPTLGASEAAAADCDSSAASGGHGGEQGLHQLVQQLRRVTGDSSRTGTSEAVGEVAEAADGHISGSARAGLEHLLAQLQRATGDSRRSTADAVPASSTGGGSSHAAAGQLGEPAAQDVAHAAAVALPLSQEQVAAAVGAAPAATYGTEFAGSRRVAARAGGLAWGSGAGAAAGAADYASAGAHQPLEAQHQQHQQQPHAAAGSSVAELVAALRRATGESRRNTAESSPHAAVAAAAAAAAGELDTAPVADAGADAPAAEARRDRPLAGLSSPAQKQHKPHLTLALPRDHSTRDDEAGAQPRPANTEAVTEAQHYQQHQQAQVCADAAAMGADAAAAARACGDSGDGVQDGELLGAGSGIGGLISALQCIATASKLQEAAAWAPEVAAAAQCQVAALESQVDAMPPGSEYAQLVSRLSLELSELNKQGLRSLQQVQVEQQQEGDQDQRLQQGLGSIAGLLASLGGAAAGSGADAASPGAGWPRSVLGEAAGVADAGGGLHPAAAALAGAAAGDGVSMGGEVGSLSSGSQGLQQLLDALRQVAAGRQGASTGDAWAADPAPQQLTAAAAGQAAVGQQPTAPGLQQPQLLPEHHEVSAPSSSLETLLAALQSARNSTHTALPAGAAAAASLVGTAAAGSTGSSGGHWGVDPQAATCPAAAACAGDDGAERSSSRSSVRHSLQQQFKAAAVEQQPSQASIAGSDLAGEAAHQQQPGSQTDSPAAVCSPGLAGMQNAAVKVPAAAVAAENQQPQQQQQQQQQQAACGGAVGASAVARAAAVQLPLSQLPEPTQPSPTAAQASPTDSEDLQAAPARDNHPNSSSSSADGSLPTASNACSPRLGVDIRSLAVVFDRRVPNPVKQQLTESLEACGAAVVQGAPHLGCGANTIVAEAEAAAAWLPLLLDVVTPAWLGKALKRHRHQQQQQQQQQQQGGDAAVEASLAAAPQTQRLVRLSPDAARAVGLQLQQPSASLAAAATNGCARPRQDSPMAAAAAAPSELASTGSTLTGNRASPDGQSGQCMPAVTVPPGYAVTTAGCNMPVLLQEVQSDCQQQQQVMMPATLLTDQLWSVGQHPRMVAEEELEAVVLPGGPGTTLTLLLPQSSSSLLGHAAISCGPSDPGKGITCGDVLAAVHDFYQQDVLLQEQQCCWEAAATAVEHGSGNGCSTTAAGPAHGGSGSSPGGCGSSGETIGGKQQAGSSSRPAGSDDEPQQQGQGEGAVDATGSGSGSSQCQQGGRVVKRLQLLGHRQMFEGLFRATRDPCSTVYEVCLA